MKYNDNDYAQNSVKLILNNLGDLHAWSVYHQDVLLDVLVEIEDKLSLVKQSIEEVEQEEQVRSVQDESGMAGESN